MIDFIEYYKTRGHVFGECMSKANTDLMYVNIPKNASSWTKSVLLEQEWEIYNYHTDNLYHKHAIVVLREPVGRWLSGIAEYMYLYHRNLDSAHVSNMYFDLIFDKVAFDDHTEQQVLFLDGINLGNCTFFLCDSSYQQLFSQYLDGHGMNNWYFKYDYQHVTENSIERFKFNQIFKKALEEKPKYLKQVTQYFRKDHNLINLIKFYGTP